MAHRYVCCIDFGTTYSAVAYHKELVTDGNVEEIPGSLHSVVRPDDLQSIHNYPCRPSKELPVAEVPTELYYEDEKVFWGYEVQRRLKGPSGKSGTHLSRFKLLLDKDQRHDEQNALTKRNLRRLNKSTEDVITEYLICLLRHTKTQLELKGLQETDKVDLVVTVPAIWDIVAEEVMRTVTESAAQEVGFGQGRDVFLVSEPSAAATFFSENDLDAHLRVDRSFVICDAGGGTVDLISYSVTGVSPLCLDEVVKGDGACCGSSYLNETFRTELSGILRSRPELDQSDTFIDAQVELQMWHFETDIKRTFEGTYDKGLEDCLLISGLAEDPSNDSGPGIYRLSEQLMRSIFTPQLHQILDLIRSQLKEAESKRGIQIKHVFLVGGFAGSLALQIFLQQNLPGCTFVVPSSPDTAIASGGVLHFLNLPHSPSEIVRASYGFLQTEVYSPETYEGHRLAGQESDMVTEDDVDGKEYVDNCVQYFIKQNDRLPATGRTFEVEKPLERTISTLDEDLIIELHLYSNDSNVEVQNHYSLKHEINQGCVPLGPIHFTLHSEELRSLGLRWKEKLPRRANSKRKGYWTVCYRPVIKIQGRNMRYELWFNNQKRSSDVRKVDSTFIPDLSRLSI